MLVAVHDSTFACQSSAFASYDAARAGSPFARAMSAAQISAAISVAIVFGDQPSWFSQRSCCVFGPFSAMKSAAARTWRQSSAPRRPSHQASTTGSATSSSCRLVQNFSPSTFVFCHHDPSAFWTRHR